MKKVRIAQPDLDYMAPEVQLETASYATAACDMFSLGSLICALYNSGNSPIRAAYNLSTYASHAKQVLTNITLNNNLFLVSFTRFVTFCCF